LSQKIDILGLTKFPWSDLGSLSPQYVGGAASGRPIASIESEHTGNISYKYYVSLLGHNTIFVIFVSERH